MQIPFNAALRCFSACVLSFFSSVVACAQDAYQPPAWQTPSSAHREPSRVQVTPAVHSESNRAAQANRADQFNRADQANPSTASAGVQTPERMTDSSQVIQAGFQQPPSVPSSRLNIPAEVTATVPGPNRVQSDAPNASRDVSKLTKLPTAKPAIGSDIPKSTGGWKSIVTTISALLVVISLFVGFAMLTRRAWRPSQGNLPKQVFEVLGKTAYAPRQQILVVRFGHKLLLINQEQGNVQTLSEIDAPEEVDRIVGLCEQQSSQSISTSFSNVLSQVMHGQGEKSSKKSLFPRTNPPAILRKVG